MIAYVIYICKLKPMVRCLQHSQFRYNSRLIVKTNNTIEVIALKNSLKRENVSCKGNVIKTVPFGSYTGCPTGRSEKPVQNAGDP